jgi:hypothetical protein
MPAQPTASNVRVFRVNVQTAADAGVWPPRGRSDLDEALQWHLDPSVVTLAPYSSDELKDVIRYGQQYPRQMTYEENERVEAARRAYYDEQAMFERWAVSSMGVKRQFHSTAVPGVSWDTHLHRPDAARERNTTATLNAAGVERPAEVHGTGDGSSIIA